MFFERILNALNDIIGSIPCGYEKWSEIWGDPIISGTVLIIGYGVTGYAVLAVSRQFEGRERLLWRLSAFVLFLLVFNTHLDFQAFVWSYGKCLSKAQGWYEIRHGVQAWMLIVALGTITALALFVLAYFRNNLLRNFLLLMGMTIVLGILVVEAIDYRWLEPYYAGDFGYFDGDDLIELLGISIVFFAVAVRRRQSKGETS